MIPILAAQGASYHVLKGWYIHSCVQTYGADYLQSLKRTAVHCCAQSVLTVDICCWNLVIGGWLFTKFEENRAYKGEMYCICGDWRVPLSERELNVELYRHWGIQVMADVGRCDRLRSFCNLEHKRADDFVSIWRNVEVVGMEGRGRSRKIWVKVWDRTLICLVWIENLL